VNTFISTLELLGRVKARLVAMEASAGVPLFDKVEFYAQPNIVKALEELRLFKQKICLIVPSGDDYESEFAGVDVRSEVTREFVLLFSDRDYGKRQDASTGDEKRVGVIAMKDAIEENLLGQNLDYNPRMIRLRPMTGEAVLLSDKDKDRLTGREAWSMTWQASGGRKIVREK
jgi:hypothetical protein